MDIHSETIFLHRYEKKAVETKLVSALDIARAFTHDLKFYSGILPETALWWSSGPGGSEVALWRSPRLWKVAIQLEAFKPPLRLSLPMPGLVFLCRPGWAPYVYAAKQRPASLKEMLYHAPLFNVYSDGRTCAGTHNYPDDISQIPEDFFTSFFTRDGQHHGRSTCHPDDLLAWWQELDGKAHYPVSDLVELGAIEDLNKRR